MTQQHASLQLIGETVTVSYVADPVVGRGQFRLVNAGPDPALVSVESAWLELGEHRQSLSSVTVFDFAQELMVSPGGFQVEAGATMTFLLGFPRIEYNPRFGESGAVGLRLRADGDILEAVSPIQFVRRIPYTR